MSPNVIAVSCSAAHTFSKDPQAKIRLLTGLGVEGDAHAGVTVKHRSRVAKDPTQPNLRQVHLLHSELFDELEAAGFAVTAGAMGENILPAGLKRLELPAGTRLAIGSQAVVELTGLRNPCGQLDGLQSGLLAATLERDRSGGVIRKAGVMAIVVAGGEVAPGDAIQVVLPATPHRALEVV